ncbi:MAG: NAD(P)/FAD-dependent oxidoreductase [Proteobacteria bacterium]|nr:NAD(P)/FAD-dependent oxidoreductase [Pseudomonadota bacterium]
MYDVVVIGAGFAGLYSLYRFSQAGLRVIGFERGGDVGGVWYWNRYPGARCDCESNVYSFSFSHELQQEWSWSLRYSEQPEILRYLGHVADRFDLRRHIRFNSSVVAAHFDENGHHWRVVCSDGSSVRARFVVSAVGGISAVQHGQFPGIERFAGPVYHTAEWPHEGVQLAGRRVGIIGTGASGVQCAAAIAPEVRHLTVFQRTANWVFPVWNQPTDPDVERQVKEHYRELSRASLETAGGFPFELVDTPALSVSAEERSAVYERAWKRGGVMFMSQSFGDLLVNAEANETAADFVRGHIRRVVKDPAVAERLIPVDHPIGTKRPPMDDRYYETFNRDNVTLVDIRKAPIREFVPHGIRTADQTYELDVIILATGFDAITGGLTRIDIRGRGGESLADKWAQGARSYLGLGVAGFPNLFTITGPLSPSVLANMPIAIEQHVDWIAECLAFMRQHGHNTVEATEQAEAQWTDHSMQVAAGTLFPRANSWYHGSNVPGKPRAFGVYVGGFGNYKRRCDAEAREGYPGFAFDRAAGPASRRRIP